MEDEEERRPSPAAGLPRLLEGLSIEDLETYRSALQNEITRVDAELSRRRSVRGAADALFRPRPTEAR